MLRFRLFLTSSIFFLGCFIVTPFVGAEDLGENVNKVSVDTCLPQVQSVMNVVEKGFDSEMAKYEQDSETPMEEMFYKLKASLSFLDDDLNLVCTIPENSQSATTKEAVLGLNYVKLLPPATLQNASLVQNFTGCVGLASQEIAVVRDRCQTYAESIVETESDSVRSLMIQNTMQKKTYFEAKVFERFNLSMQKLNSDLMHVVINLQKIIQSITSLNGGKQAGS